jgi:hypothetical protein
VQHLKFDVLVAVVGLLFFVVPELLLYAAVVVVQAQKVLQQELVPTVQQVPVKGPEQDEALVQALGVGQEQEQVKDVRRRLRRRLCYRPRLFLP